MKLRVILWVVVILVATCSSRAQIPHTLSYQGVLTDTSGTPRPDGAYSFTFRLYSISSGGTPIWSETKSTQVKHGLFSTILGSVTPLPDSVTFNQQYWLGLQVASDPELLPRIQLTSVGSSLSSLRADMAQTVPDNSLTGGKIASGQVVKSINNLHDDLTMRGANGASVTTNGDTITITASGGGGGGIQSIQNTDNTLSVTNPGGPTATVNAQIPFSLSGSWTGEQGALQILGDKPTIRMTGGSLSGNQSWMMHVGADGPGNLEFFRRMGPAQWLPMMALTTGGNVGIGTATPQSKLDISAQDGLRIRGYQPYLTLTDANAGDARTAIQNGNGNLALFAAADLASGIPTLTINSSGGLLAQNLNTAANASAMLGVITSSSPGGSSAAIKGVNNGVGDNGVGVWGEQHGNGFGVYGSASNGAGLYAVSSTGYGVLAGSTYGVGIKGASGGAYSVVGQNYASGNTFGALGYHGNYPFNNTDAGVFGYSSGGFPYSACFVGPVRMQASGNDVGLYVDGSSWAASFGGEVHMYGGLWVTGGKNFMIDHPEDPANKYLIHSCVESPDRMNIYNGNIVTDVNGMATVDLPSYFEALNIDYRYQLTVIGQFAQAIVESEIQNNRFTIKTDKPNVKVSWQVTGIRNDAYAKAHPMIVEKEKDVNDKGKYLMPELFGQPAEKGIHYMPAPKLPGPERTGAVEKEVK